MIKKIQIELIILLILFLHIFVSSSFDINIYKKITNLDLSLNNEHFKNFFINITELGDSLWFFLISAFLYIICFLIKKRFQNKKYINKIKKASLFLFVSVLITGILTQIIKLLIGRPRPNHAHEVDSLGFNFLSLDSGFHSFPSGHSSTIFIVALVLSILTPKIKYFYLFFAFIVGLSRVVVGAHYFSDVFGGIIIAFIGLKLTLFFFNNFKKKTNISNSIKFNPNLFYSSLIIFFIIIIYLTVGNSLDVFFSGLFYNENQIFILQSFSYITILAREIFLPLLILYLLILPIISLYLPIDKIYFGFKFNIKKILFLWGSIIFNIIFIINMLLKELWGRARPNDILWFGGNEIFTPWFKITNACYSNCSFVSGDAAIGFSVISLFFLTQNKNFYWLALSSGLFLGLIRILEGGHFLSDIIISGFIVFVLTNIHFVIYKKKFDNDL